MLAVYSIIPFDLGFFYANVSFLWPVIMVHIKRDDIRQYPFGSGISSIKHLMNTKYCLVLL